MAEKDANTGMVINLYLFTGKTSVDDDSVLYLTVLQKFWKRLKIWKARMPSLKSSVHVFFTEPKKALNMPTLDLMSPPKMEDL